MEKEKRPRCSFALGGNLQSAMRGQNQLEDHGKGPLAISLFFHPDEIETVQRLAPKVVHLPVHDAVYDLTRLALISRKVLFLVSGITFTI